MQMTRSWIAIAKGLSEGRPELVGIFDNAGHMLDDVTLETLPLDESRQRIDNVVTSYR